MNGLYGSKIFLYSLFSQLKIKVVGELPVGEIIGLLSLLSGKKTKNIFIQLPDIKYLFVAFTVLVISQIGSDLINGTLFLSSIRGWANLSLGFAMILFLASTLVENPKLILLLLIGQILSLLLFYWNIPEVNEKIGGFYKYIITPVINNSLLVFSWFLIKKYLSLGVWCASLSFFIYGICGLILDTRSNGMIFIMLSLLLPLFYNVIISYKTLLIGVFALVLLSISAMSLYTYSVLNHTIINKRVERQLRLANNPYNPLEVLLIGRAETYAALQAIKEKPFIGYGSWPGDPQGRFTRQSYKIRGYESYVKSGNLDLTKQTIPSHSVLFGVWLCSGILGFAAILFIMLFFLKKGFLALSRLNHTPYLPLILFFILDGVWIFFFSPLRHIRASLPILISFILVVSTHRFSLESSKSLVNE